MLYRNALTGYDLRKCMENGVGMFYKASYGSIYPLLEKLSEQGMVSYTENTVSNRKQKKYAISDKGRKHFDYWLTEYEPSDLKIEAFMAKLYFCDHLEESLVTEKMECFCERINRKLQELYQERKQYLKMTNQEEFYYKLSTLYFGITKLQSLLDWCNVVKNRSSLEYLIMQENREM